MCGITGFIDFSKNTTVTILDQMVATQRHRGPDDLGSKLYLTDNATIGLGQTRLSIIDLSIAGHQPMEFNNLSIIFNGEIYNYREIKKELVNHGHRFSSTSDTEIILHAFEEWGANCVNKFIGMFAFVIYDKSANNLYAFRDRAGVKPFYYFQSANIFLFGSELKALIQHPSFEKVIDYSALKSYFDFGYIPAPYSIFKKTYKLEPGSYLKYDIATNKVEKKFYWKAVDFYKKSKLKIGFKEAKEELHSLLRSAFEYRMIADVPVGIFLSGGYDSTAVAAILQKRNPTRLKTFTIGFEEGNNEAPFAKNTAAYLGTEHYEYTCTTRKAQDIIPVLPYFFDEPFADSSAIPTILVSRFAKKQVSVALSADAGDELFAGYDSYPNLMHRLRWLNQIPNSLKEASSTILSKISEVVPASQVALKHKVEGVSKALNENQYKQAVDMFRFTNSLPNTYMDQLFSTHIEGLKTHFNIDSSGFQNVEEIALAIDYLGYLQNDILTKVDRSTMSVSLEGRDPLVDHRLLEFVARLPLNYKYDGQSTKRILKDIVHDYVPQQMMDRPKSGFSLPIYQWLRNDLSFLLDEYLNEQDLATSGLFNVPFLLDLTDRFKKRKLHYSPLIWKLLMFQMWYKRWMD